MPQSPPEEGPGRRRATDPSGRDLSTPAASHEGRSSPVGQGRIASEATWPEVDRRRTPDRRGRPTNLLDALLMRGRRRGGRRKGETSNVYVDLYERREILLVFAVLALNILDALLTLDYLDKGGYEANPVARGLLDLGDTWFLVAKSFLVGLCLVFLMVHKTFAYVTQALLTLTVFYTLLFLYHLFLQLRYAGLL